MKGLDLFLVLLILLSWRRCLSKLQFQQGQQGVHALLTTTCASYITFTFSSSSSSAAVEQALPTNIDSGDHWMRKGKLGNFQNLNYTVAPTSNQQEIYQEFWEDDDQDGDFQHHPRGTSSTNGLKNTAHYMYAHDEDFDEETHHRQEGESDEGDESEDENNSSSSSSSSSSEEYAKHKIFEHRRLGAYLRKHHYQHVKRLRLLRKEEEERRQDSSRFNASPSHPEEDPNEIHVRNAYHPSPGSKTNKEKEAIRKDGGGGSEHHVEQDQRFIAPHHYNRHDSQWKSKKHGQHSKQVRNGKLEGYESQHHHHQPGSHLHQDDNGGDPKADEKLSQSWRRHHIQTIAPSGSPKSGSVDGEQKKFHIGRDKVFRHPNRFLDKFYMDTQQGFMDPDNLSQLDLNVSTISELIWKLRGMRSRRRRSFQAMMLSQNQTRNKTGLSKRDSVSSGGPITDLKRLVLSNVTWPLKRIAEIEGDIWLGGLMMVHEREDNITCGPIMPQGGIQSLETMLYTIDWINKHDIIPGVKIGAYILDDCDKDTYGLEQAVDFIKGSISNIDDVDLTSTCSDGAPEYPGGRRHRVIAGVVGAASSVTSIQVANLLRLFKIPQVSYFSTSPELSNKQRFEFFSRTIPSDKHQVKAMVEIVKQFGWQYVSIIYEESNYGIKAFEELERLLPENDICIAAKEKLVKDSGVAGEDSYERIVDKLVAGKARGVILYGSDQEVKELMRAVRKRNETGSFAWIGSDGWSARTLVSDGNEREVEGTLSVQPKANPVKGFDRYFLNLNVRSNTRNPWFIEFWEHHWQCKYPNSSRTPYNLGYGKSCSGYEKLTADNTVFEAQLQYVSDAVMAFAYALKDMHESLCGGKPGLCAKMNPVDGTELLEYLKKSEFKGLSEDYFHFDEFADGPARYNIIHFRRREDSGTFHWTRVGEYNEGILSLNMSGLQFANLRSTPPVSICSEPCGLGEATRYVGGDKCCWSCLKCVNDQIRNPKDEQECSVCPMGTLPNFEHTVCVPIKEEYLRYSDGWAIGAMTFAGVGCILTSVVVGIFMAHNDTPVVRAAGRELSYVILIGLFFCYALTFLFIIRPNDWMCGVQQFMTGFVFTVVYAALLTKTNRIARIFEAGKKSARRPSFISPRSQLVICSMMVTIQVLINVVWMLLQPPRAKYYYPTRQDNFLVCEAYINHSYAVAFWYPLLIICVCTVYAVLTRKIPEAFNESKYIGFTMYTTCIIWLAFVPIYFSTGTQVALRVTSMTVAISLSAYVMIACLFGPKLYIILFHPERNIRQSMMAPAARYSTIASTAATCGAPGGPASLNASALGGSGHITPIQMTTSLKQNHFENSSTKGNLPGGQLHPQKQSPPPPVKVDCGTQCDDDLKGPQSDCKRKSLENSTISTQTEDSSSTKIMGKGGESGESNEQVANDKQDEASHKHCNHAATTDQESFSEPVAATTTTTTSPQSADSSSAIVHPQQHHHHHAKHHQPQPQRPQRISFRKEGQPPSNQQSKGGGNSGSGRNPVLGDNSKVTIIVAKDSGDVLL